TRALDLPHTMPGIGAEDMLKLYQGADFVITDSFHGTAFSLIYEKPFLAVGNGIRGYSRFEDLLGRFGLTDRLVYDRDLDHFSATEAFLQPPDYQKVGATIAQAREDSLQWLSEALEAPVTEKSAVAFVDVTHNMDKAMCMGCGACVSACPTDALALEPDATGFFRSVVDYDRCVECSACTKLCPANQLPPTNNTTSPTCHEFVSSDKKVLRSSSSGGIFTTMAREVFRQGGVVFGAAWTDDLAVEHIAIESERELHKLQKSKYVQSYSGSIFRSVRSYLDEGRLVLFSGTPCQTAGLRAFLKRDYENLVIVDILCGNAPSTMFFKKYVDQAFDGNAASYEFRYKDDEFTWSCSHMKVGLKSGDTIVVSGERQDDYQRVFHNHAMCAVHCEKCRYQSLPRFGDLTIGDFWGIERREPDLDVKDGVSLVLCNSEKGTAFYDSLPAEAARVNKMVPLEWMGGNGHSLAGGKNWGSPTRDLFIDAIQRMPFREAVDFALKPNHGHYRAQYERSNAFLQYDANMLHFRFEPDIWEEIVREGRTHLIVKEGKWSLGHYARLPLAKALEKGKRYRLCVRFRIKSQANVLNLHVIDSGSKI
ncbi:MAG: Coenzyme F420 hydrogenase/dehydrogenase, beta subunit C-terminal domain, partial [Eggerthellaceae bacterium]|nr:Coenzyme F420 hydrogenase/dehydrogenase, beta subunit C-terminal domain [Eggerthellaceae bacterium]